MSVKIEAIEAPNDAENEGIKHPALTSASFSRNNLRMQVDEFGVRVSYENDGTCTSYRSYFDVQRLLDDHILVSIVELLGDYIYQIPCDGAEQVDAVPDNGA